MQKTCSRQIFSHILTSLTNCFAEYGQQTLYAALLVTSHVTAPYKLLIYYYVLNEACYVLCIHATQF